MLIDENFSPQRVLANIDTLLWLEKSLPWELFLSTLLTAFDNSGPLFLDSLDQALQSRHKVLPVVLRNSATDFVTS